MSSTVPPPNMPPEAAAAQLVMQLGTGHFLASALQVVLRLAIPDRLADGPRTTADLARETEVQEDAPRRFALTLTGQMLRTGVPGGMRDMGLWITSPFHFRVYGELMHSVRT